MINTPYRQKVRKCELGIYINQDFVLRTSVIHINLEQNIGSTVRDCKLSTQSGKYKYFNNYTNQKVDGKTEKKKHPEYCKIQRTTRNTSN